MKINSALLLIVLVVTVISCRGTSDLEEGVGDAKKGSVSVSGSDGSVNGTVHSMNKGNSVNLENNDLTEQLDIKEKEREVKNGNDGDKRDEPKKGSKKGRLPPLREKCDSSSNRCTDDDKTLVACLIVPGNESPALSLLILNKGKGSQRITISAPDSVQLEKTQIELQENKDTEVKVSLRDVVNGHFIVLTAEHGHGNCTLDLKDGVAGMKTNDDNLTPTSFNIHNLTFSRGVVILGCMVIVGVSVFLCRKSGRTYLARKAPKYQRLDMELPVSHGSPAGAGGNEGWDNSWGESWDDEEAASVAPSLPLTPTLSSRKFKEGWKD